MVFVLANMSHFGFRPVKKIVVFSSCNIFLFLFQKQNILEGPFLKSKDFAKKKVSAKSFDFKKGPAKKDFVRTIFLINQFSH